MINVFLLISKHNCTHCIITNDIHCRASQIKNSRYTIGHFSEVGLFIFIFITITFLKKGPLLYYIAPCYFPITDFTSPFATG